MYMIIGRLFRDKLNQDQLSNMFVIKPSIEEQIAIANFLDKKTSGINALVEKDKRLIELLKEKRAALINHAVTKGLDPNVKMKDLGSAQTEIQDNYQ